MLDFKIVCVDDTGANRLLKRGGIYQPIDARTIDGVRKTTLREYPGKWFDVKRFRLATDLQAAEPHDDAAQLGNFSL